MGSTLEVLLGKAVYACLLPCGCTSGTRKLVKVQSLQETAPASNVRIPPSERYSTIISL